MAKKIVKYNGQKESYYPCSDPSVLEIGKEYKVISEHDRGFQTDYTLDGVRGYFNSCWFEEVKPSFPPTFIAISVSVPVVGKQLTCTKLVFEENEWRLKHWRTTKVEMMEQIGEYIYKVKTRNSIYIVQIQP